MQAAKNGFFYVIDRLTGELLSAEPFAHVTWATHVDKKTGRPVERPGARYDTKGAWVSPGWLGAHSWPPMSWNPKTKLVYIPGENSVSFYHSNLGSAQVGNRRHSEGQLEPPSVPGPAAFLLAWDPVTQSERWRIELASTSNGGTLTTAGDLVFISTAHGWLQAYDAHTGRKLW